MQRLSEFCMLTMMTFKRNATHVVHPQYHAETEALLNAYIIGWGLYKYNSLMLHSCMPNTYGVMFEGKNIVCYATVPIQPGEEITANFIGGTDWDHYTIQERRDMLLERLHFSCKCDACERG